MGDQRVRYDREATAAGYRSFSADRSNDMYHRNFAPQWAEIYPAAFRELLDQLGVDASKVGEVYDQVGPFEQEIRPTGGWFYFVGQLVEPGERLVQDGDFQYWFQPSFPRPPACFGDECGAIEFVAQVRWVLDDSAGY